jgi:hypothetical protein
MKVQTAKAGFWFVTLAMAGTVAMAQISPTQSFSAIHYSDKRDIHSFLNTVKASEVASPVVAVSEASLPDAPSAVAEKESAQEPASAPGNSMQAPPRPPASSSIGATFLIANGMLLGSTIANAEMIGRCQPSACQSVPDAIRNRGDLYAIGIPATFGVSYISYRLKRSGTRFWIAPVALFTAGNIVYAVHASHFSSH